MKPLLLVDGYNIIGAWHEAKVKGYSLDESRDRLFHLLEDYAGYTGEEVIVVFDGHHTHSKTRTQHSYQNATIVFTKQGETADSFIERQVALAPRYRQVRVATNDSSEQSQIFSGGATRLTAGELLLTLNETRTKERTKRENEMLLQRNPLARHLTREQCDILESMRRGK